MNMHGSRCTVPMEFPHLLRRCQSIWRARRRSSQDFEIASVRLAMMFVIANSVAKQPLCRSFERSALLQFMHSFSIQTSAHPKFASWTSEWRDDNCCLWDGVECDQYTGHVIGLNLGSSFLYGSINSDSSLFRLDHLRSLNLADNHFNYSQIPREISGLKSLSFLNLSSSFFSGQIPQELLRMSNLIVLDLSENVDDNFPFVGLLKLEKSSFSMLVFNLTNLEHLYLSTVHINSAIPEILANFSSLKTLGLRDCGLYGEFPTRIFHMPNLEVLILSLNQNLTGHLPEFRQQSPLKVLKIAFTSFSGRIPDSIGYLDSLTELDLGGCKFSGSLPASLGNLTQLQVLSLSHNKWKLSYLGKLTKLTILHLSSSNLYGQLPSPLANLTHLTVIDLGLNHLTCQIPSWIMNFTHLTSMDLSRNQLHGSIPWSLMELSYLQLLFLHENNLSGTVNAETFFNLKHLTQLILSRNNLSLVIDATVNANTTLPKFKVLGLGSCNLKEFPDFLRFQDELEMISLQRNMIHGQMPKWIWNLTWPSLNFLDLSYNVIEGILPILPHKAFFYKVSNNRFSGEIPPSICRMSSLVVLDLSDNDMSGRIPTCVFNFSHSLSVLNLKGNKFQGTIPEIYSNESNLSMIDLSRNRLEGRVSRFLGNCKMLQTLILGDNQIWDRFPFWLGGLLHLQVLILRPNKFHGAIVGSSLKSLEMFSKLRIIDLSNNGFTGDLPINYFQMWSVIKTENVNWPEYLQLNMSYQVQAITWDGSYDYSMTIYNKGVKTDYEKILIIFTAIDLSRNKFQGEIPPSVGRSLKGLQLLNLSNNHLTGTIPLNVGNLTHLESLDLSQNEISGEIPRALSQLTFLAFLNVSYNYLVGVIPQGKQFDTFQNTSYINNTALCGDPLNRRCENPEILTPQTTDQDEGVDGNQLLGEVGWIVIFIGYGSGLVVGVFFGWKFATRNHEWFVRKFGRRQEKRRRKK